MIESVIRVVEYGQIQLDENRGVLVMMRGDNVGGEMGWKKMSECRPTYTYHHTNEQNIVTWSEWESSVIGDLLPTSSSSSSPRHNYNEKKGPFYCIGSGLQVGIRL
jgi:hypothetical protein